MVESTGSDAAIRAAQARHLRLIFDVTTLLSRTAAQPTGIERLLVEIASGLLEADSGDVAFCAYVPAAKRFRRVEHGEVQAQCVRMRGQSPDADPAPRRNEGRLFARAARRVARRAPTTARHLRIALGHGRAAIRELTTPARPGPAEIPARNLGQTERSSTCFSASWAVATTYCSIGMDWLFNDLGVLRAAKEKQGFGVALAVHDLLPVVAPQFSGVEMTEYYEQVLALADRLIVYSDCTAGDIAEFASTSGLPLPPTFRLPLGSDLSNMQHTEPLLDDGTRLRPGGFVLCVGTVTIRKNHRLLLDVWEEMLERHGAESTPVLVVAGARGWLSAETMSRLTRTPAFEGVVHHLAHSSDGEIAWLYHHCAFTVYPSLYEGWGLPVSESLDFGKVCLTSDRSSIPEAGGGLTPLLDPLDRAAWLAHVRRYWQDGEHRSLAEERIRSLHRRVPADESARAILRLASPTGDDDERDIA